MYILYLYAVYLLSNAGQLVLSGCWCSVLVAVGAACQQGTGAGCQLVLSGCWWFCAGGYGCRVPA